MEQAEFQRQFRVVVEKIFNNWQNLKLAIEHGMGGSNGQQMAIQVMDYTYQYCIGNDNITQSELQEVMEDLMDEQFNTICDDGSIEEICRNLLRYKLMMMQNKYADIEMELSKLPHNGDWLRPGVRIAQKPIEDDSSESDDSIDGDETGEESMDVEIAEADSTSATGKQHEFVEPEPGWTTVRNKRK